MSNPSDVFIFLDSFCLCMFFNSKKEKDSIFYFSDFVIFLEVLFLEIAILNFRSPYFGDFIFL